jgi:hypothetical protein
MLAPIAGVTIYYSTVGAGDMIERSPVGSPITLLAEDRLGNLLAITIALSFTAL